MQQLFIFCIGAFGYTALEILWRGYSHWTMALTGGFCFVMIYFINTRLPASPLLLRALLCALSITAVEFFVGCIVNRALGWNVWDYSAQPYNLLGQICPLYSLLWFLLSIPLGWLTMYLRI